MVTNGASGINVPFWSHSWWCKMNPNHLLGTDIFLRVKHLKFRFAWGSPPGEREGSTLHTQCQVHGLQKEKAELWGTALSSLKQIPPHPTPNILKIPLPLILNISHPGGSEGSECWTVGHCTRLILFKGQRGRP